MKASVETRKMVGIDIHNASTKVKLKELVLSKLPAKVRTIAA